MSPIEHRRLPPHARQVASCSRFSKVHLEQGVTRCNKVHLEQIVFKGEDCCASLFYLRHDHRVHLNHPVITSFLALKWWVIQIMIHTIIIKIIIIETTLI